MDLRKIKSLLALIVCVTFFSTANAEPTPRWVTKGVKELDKGRSNDSYSFHVFHTYNADESFLAYSRFQPLLDYVKATYGVEHDALSFDSIPGAGKLPTTYYVDFMKDGEPLHVEAQLVDSYTKFDDYADGEWEYNLWQLYAISQAGVTPRFDDFKVTRDYNIESTAMSLVPGLGQIYKGQKAKGYTIMGAEALMIIGVVYGTVDANYYWKLEREQRKLGHTDIADSYHSKAATGQQLRLFCAITGAGIYVYNLLDAAFSKGARYVEIKRKKAPSMELTFTPVMSYNEAGVGMRLKF